MASPKRRHGALRRSASTTRRFFASSDLAQRTSMACAQTAPCRTQRNARRSGRNPRTRRKTMSDINTARSNGILSVELNRPARKNAITGAMYTTLAGIFREAAADSGTQVVLWHGAGGSFSAGNDVEDFLKNPP